MKKHAGKSAAGSDGKAGKVMPFSKVPAGKSSGSAPKGGGNTFKHPKGKY